MQMRPMLLHVFALVCFPQLNLVAMESDACALLKIINNSDSPTFVRFYKAITTGWVYNTYDGVDTPTQVPAGETLIWSIYKKRPYARYLAYAKKAAYLGKKGASYCSSEYKNFNNVQGIVEKLFLGTLSSYQAQKIRDKVNKQKIDEFNTNQRRRYSNLLPLIIKNTGVSRLFFYLEENGSSTFDNMPLIGVDAQEEIRVLVPAKSELHRFICYSHRFDFARNQDQINKKEFYDDTHLSDGSSIDIWTQSPKEQIYQESAQHILDHNRKHPMHAQLRLEPGLSQEEMSYLRKRAEITRPALERILNELLMEANQASTGSNSNNKIELKFPCIGLSFSGGGWRAMLSTLGFLQGLHGVGLLDTTTHSSSLSGSTWCLLKWLELGGTTDRLWEMQNQIQKFLPKESFFPKKYRGTWGKVLAAKDIYLEVEGDHLPPDFIARHWASTQELLSATRAWGMILEQSLFQNRADGKHTLTLSSLAETAHLAGMPLPICTAINRAEGPLHAQSYDWFEFTPFTVGLIGKELQPKAGILSRLGALLGLMRNNPQLHTPSIPTWSLGRVFKDEKGKVTSVRQSADTFVKRNVAKNLPQEALHHIEPAIGQLLGAFGSAMTVRLDELVRQGAVAESTVKRATNAVGFNPASQLLEGLKINNFYDPSATKKTIEFRDAGLDCNLPILPLLDPHRNINMIITLDASGDLHEDNKIGSELKKFRDLALARKLKLAHDMQDEASFARKLQDIYNNKSSMEASLFHYHQIAEARLRSLKKTCSQDSFETEKSEIYNTLNTARKLILEKYPQLAVFGDIKNKDELLVIYVPTIQNRSLPVYNDLIPTKSFGTFKMEYSKTESETLIGYNICLARYCAPFIKKIMYQRILAMNKGKLNGDSHV